MPGRLGSMPAKLAPGPKVAEGFYQSAEWLRYRRWHREETIRREGGLWCCKCGSTHRLILDHTVERKDGGPDFPPYEGAKWHCARCHNAKTARERAARAGGRTG